MKIVVGVPAFNCWNYTHSTLESISSKKHSLEILLIDQGSKPEVLEQERKYSREHGITMIENGRNTGCAAGWNQVIEYGLPRAPYVFVANNDILLRDYTIDNIVDFWENRPHPSIMLVGAWVLEARSGYSLEALHKYAPKGLFTYGFPGPFFMFTEETRKRAGLFDTFYSQGNGIYFEDNDYFWTLLEKGLTGVYVHSAPVFHHGSRTLYDALDKPKTQQIYDRNRKYFLEKHHTPTAEWGKRYEIVNGVVKRR